MYQCHGCSAASQTATETTRATQAYHAVFPIVAVAILTPAESSAWREPDRHLLVARDEVCRPVCRLSVVDQLDIETMEHRTAPDGLPLNAIGRVRIRLAEDVPVDDYRVLRRTGAFLLTDESDGATLAAGMADAPDRAVGEGI